MNLFKLFMLLKLKFSFNSFIFLILESQTKFEIPKIHGQLTWAQE